MKARWTLPVLILVMFLVAETVAAIGAAHANDNFTVTTQNVRVGMPRAHSQHDINQAAEHSSILFTQEMGRRVARTYAPKGWGTAHYAGNDRGDCATFWDRSVWRFRSKRLVQFEFASFKNGHRFALVTVLKNRATSNMIATVCVHSITRSLARNSVFLAGMRRLQTLLDRLGRFPYVVIGGDWNRTYPDRFRFKGFASVRPQHATGGNGTGGRIDYLYWSRHTLGQTGHRVIGDTYSDHQGFRVHLAGSVF